MTDFQLGIIILDKAENSLENFNGSVSEYFGQLRKYVDNQFAELFTNQYTLDCNICAKNNL